VIRAGILNALSGLLLLTLGYGLPTLATEVTGDAGVGLAAGVVVGAVLVVLSDSLNVRVAQKGRFR
jgi:hypothetical protein